MLALLEMEANQIFLKIEHPNKNPNPDFEID